MTQAQVDAALSHTIFPSRFKGWLGRSSHYLNTQRKQFSGGWRFWLFLSLLIAIPALHVVVDADLVFHQLGNIFFLPITLLFLPLIYAALTFGLIGAVVTALWIIVTSIPDLIFWHQETERVAVISQLLILSFAASYVGFWVDRGRRAWRRAEATTAALKASTIKYQSLLQSSPVAILVTDLTGAILEGNPAASLLFERDKTTFQGRHIAELIGKSDAQKLLSTCQNGNQRDSLALTLKNGRELSIEPTLTKAGDGQGDSVIQVVLRDVTQEHHREAGLRAYAAHVMRAHEDERQLIARELHDETIQTLALLCRRLDSIESSGEPLTTTLLNSLQGARKTAEEVVKGLRDFAKALRPPILDDLGMTASIRRLSTDFSERTRIPCQLMVAGEERRLPSDAELGMFRIAQEALWNVEHHARATGVIVNITFAECEARLDVIDNGIGFSVPSDSSDFIVSGHLGLISMQERAELLGGKLEVKSDSGKGTRVTVSIPVTDDNS